MSLSVRTAQESRLSLGAIDTLFHVVRAREPVCITPGTGGSELDYHQRQTGIPIRLAVELSLSDSESSNLIANIISESPQLKPAVEGLTGRNILTIRVLIASTPSAHGYVSNLLLRAVDSDQDVGEVKIHFHCHPRSVFIVVLTKQLPTHMK